MTQNMTMRFIFLPKISLIQFSLARTWSKFSLMHSSEILLPNIHKHLITIELNGKSRIGKAALLPATLETFSQTFGQHSSSTATQFSHSLIQFAVGRKTSEICEDFFSVFAFKWQKNPVFLLFRFFFLFSSFKSEDERNVQQYLYPRRLQWGKKMFQKKFPI